MASRKNRRMELKRYNPLLGIAEPLEAKTAAWCADNVYLSPRHWPGRAVGMRGDRYTLSAHQAAVFASSGSAIPRSGL